MESERKSDISGSGFGSAHAWVRGRAAQVGSATAHERTAYACAACDAIFVHRYGAVPDIFEALEKPGVASGCPGQPEGANIRAVAGVMRGGQPVVTYGETDGAFRPFVFTSKKDSLGRGGRRLTAAVPGAGADIAPAREMRHVSPSFVGYVCCIQIPAAGGPVFSGRRALLEPAARSARPPDRPGRRPDPRGGRPRLFGAAGPFGAGRAGVCSGQMAKLWPGGSYIGAPRRATASGLLRAVPRRAHVVPRGLHVRGLPQELRAGISMLLEERCAGPEALAGVSGGNARVWCWRCAVLSDPRLGALCLAARAAAEEARIHEVNQSFKLRSAAAPDAGASSPVVSGPGPTASEKSG
jgi:hypothetical protein